MNSGLTANGGAMNLADANLAAQLPVKRKRTAEEEALYQQAGLQFIQGLIIGGYMNWENPNPDLLRCWRLADKAVEARNK